MHDNPSNEKPHTSHYIAGRHQILLMITSGRLTCPHRTRALPIIENRAKGPQQRAPGAQISSWRLQVSRFLWIGMQGAMGRLKDAPPRTLALPAACTSSRRQQRCAFNQLNRHTDPLQHCLSKKHRNSFSRKAKTKCSALLPFD